MAIEGALSSCTYGFKRLDLPATFALLIAGAAFRLKMCYMGSRIGALLAYAILRRTPQPSATSQI